jgi:hypothetical protein
MSNNSNLNAFLEDFFDNFDNTFIKYEYQDEKLHEVYSSHVESVNDAIRSEISNPFCKSVFTTVLDQEIPLNQRSKNFL